MLLLATLVVVVGFGIGAALSATVVVVGFGAATVAFLTVTIPGSSVENRSSAKSLSFPFLRRRPIGFGIGGGGGGRGGTPGRLELDIAFDVRWLLVVVCDVE